MSLTNPNKVVTEERLNEYHNTILPYLGGMPEMVANKFSKGDLYSTEERMIGQWIDGKPLYQKTVTGKLSKNSSWYGINHNISNVEIIFISEALVKPSGSEWFRINYYENSGSYILATVTDAKIWLKNDDSKSNYSFTFILKYTKTTDSAISIGSDTDYSTEEKIVGTWIDGKPLYQKVFVFQNEITVTTSWTNLGIVIENLDKIIYCVGNRGGTSYASYPLNADYDPATPTLQAMACRASGQNLIKQLILQYTKTTD